MKRARELTADISDAGLHTVAELEIGVEYANDVPPWADGLRELVALKRRAFELWYAQLDECVPKNHSWGSPIPGLGGNVCLIKHPRFSEDHIRAAAEELGLSLPWKA